MKRHQIHVFGTNPDLKELLTVIEKERDLQFVRTGLFAVPEQKPLLTLRDSALGVAPEGDSAQEATYLVADRHEPIQIRTVPQHGGAIKYAVDQQLNPKTTVFRPGGIYGDKCVIAGYVGTISEDNISLALFQLFSKEIKRQFEKIESFYVGKRASELLEQGWRLTAGVKSPSLYDLKRD
jgi:hypothetical protein